MTARTVVVSEEEVGGIDRTEVQTGIGVGGTGMRKLDWDRMGVLGQGLYLSKKWMVLMLQRI